MPPAPVDTAREALVARADAARGHAHAITAYEADVTVVREVVPGLGAPATSACHSILDARERTNHVAVLLGAIARAHVGQPDGDAPLAPEPALPEAGAAEADAIRALLADATDTLAGRTGRRSRRRLAEVSSEELVILRSLLERGLTFDQLVQLLDGAHLLVPGRDALARWRRLDGARARTSSHYHDLAEPDAGPQFGLAGRFVHEVLFGPGPHGSTFVQLERAAPSRTALPRHLADWVEYRATHRNQGPYGASVFTDARPLRLAVSDLASERSDDRTLRTECAARVGAIATDLGARAGALTPELSLRDVVGVPAAVPAVRGNYDETLAAAVASVGGAAATLETLAAALRAR